MSIKYGLTVADFVKRWRKRNNMSQSALGVMLGYTSGQYISNVERGSHGNSEGFFVSFLPYLTDEEKAVAFDLLIEEASDRISRKLGDIAHVSKTTRRRVAAQI